MARSDWAMLESREGRQAAFGPFQAARRPDPARPLLAREVPDQGICPPSSAYS